jgi:outer membrane lipoprotein SlyB
MHQRSIAGALGAVSGSVAGAVLFGIIETVKSLS